MKVTDILATARQPLFTFELLPPLKGHTMEAINATIEALLPFHPAYINITKRWSTSIVPTVWSNAGPFANGRERSHCQPPSNTATVFRSCPISSAAVRRARSWKTN